MAKNIHCLQKQSSEYSNISYPYTRFLTDDFPSLSYKRRCGENKTIVHVGQLKLLLSELEFLIKVSEKYDSGIIVYAGSAPGTHLSLVINLWPQYEYILYDPRPFDLSAMKNIKKGIKLTLYNKYFNEEESSILREKYINENIFLISDIRTENTSQGIESDNLLMMRCWNIMKPQLSMFKFRVPFWTKTQDKSKILYFDGEIRFQLFAGNTSTETRLIVEEGAKQKEYDIKKIEDQLFYFNTIVRPSVFHKKELEELKLEGLDNCYDCVTLKYILKQLPNQDLEDLRSYYENIIRVLHLNHRKVYISWNNKRYAIPFLKLGIADPKKVFLSKYVWQDPIECHETQY